MGRRFLGKWADSLPLNRRPPAVIGLGILLAEYWERLEELETGGVERIADAYQTAYDRLNRPGYRKRLRWGYDVAARWEAFKKALSPDLVADAWRRFLGRTKVDLYARCKSKEQAAETFSWLAEVAWDNGAGVRTLCAEWWPSSLSSARHSWHWPLRIGFLDDSKSRRLFDAFHRSDRDWIRRLATAVEVERRPGETGDVSVDVQVQPLDAHPIVLDCETKSFAPLRACPGAAVAALFTTSSSRSKTRRQYGVRPRRLDDEFQTVRD
jgi:hypothetical protein